MRLSLTLPLLLVLAACESGGIILPDGSGGGGTTGSDTDVPSDECPFAVASSGELSFVDAVIDSPSVQYLTVTNFCDGTGDLAVTAEVLEPAGGFLVEDEGEVTLAPGESVELLVTYTADDYDEASGVLRLTTNDPTRPTLDVELTGRSAADQDRDGFDAAALGGDDCDDGDAAVYPGAEEIWYDGIDQDCAGDSDFDQDGDGFDTRPDGEDCNDTNATVNPGAEELDDGLDNDCNNLVDEHLLRAGDLIVTEIMADPVEVFDPAGEWIEVANTTDRVVNLRGWRIGGDGEAGFRVVGNQRVGPGERYVFGVNGDPATNGGVTVDFEYDRAEFALGNTRDTVNLTAGSFVVFNVEYDSSWNAAPGRTLSLDPLFETTTTAVQGAYWCPATTALSGGDFGTPGAANDLCTSVDHDGDTVSIDDGDCDDEDGTIYPDAVETWDDIDQDCDGVVDNAFVEDLEPPYAEGSTQDSLAWYGGLSFGDVDDDGDVEVLVGSSRNGNFGSTGIVYGLDPSDVETADDLASKYDDFSVSGAGRYAFLGTMGHEQGDLDGDGVADLVVAGTDRYSGFTSNVRAVLVFEGGSGVSGGLNVGDADYVFTGAGSIGDHRVQSHLDLNGDGAAELVYGDHYAAASQGFGLSGAVFVVSVSDLSTGNHTLSDADTRWEGPSSFSFFGSALGGADLDDDGYDDVVACAERADVNGFDSGACYMVFGDSAFAADDAIDDAADATLGGTNASGYFGRFTDPVFGDFDSDKDLDVAFSDQVNGEVHVFFGAGSLSGDYDIDDADVTLSGRSAPGFFGSGLAVGDFDGNGVDDLAVGAPDLNTWYNGSFGTTADEAGIVYVFDGGSLSAATTALSNADADHTIEGDEVGDQFGLVLNATDIDGDAIDDLMIGAPGQSSGSGLVWFVFGE